VSGLAWWMVGSLGFTVTLFRKLDARGRARWLEIAGAARSIAGPYRSTVVLGARIGTAPRAVRTAAAMSVLFALAAVPAVYAVLDSPHFDGIAVPLLPGLALSIASACCAAALLARATEAAHAARLTGRASLFFHACLSILALAHLVVVETEWGSQVHACSRSLALGVLGLALLATAQSFSVVRAAEASEELRARSVL
jgi:hypothetical protein